MSTIFAMKEISGDSMVDVKKVDKVIRERKKTPSQWSNLPTDLLLKVTADFNLADQIRFRCVCKNWLSLPLLDNRAIYSLLPWLVIHGDDHYLCEPNRQIIYSRLFDFINEIPLTYSELCTGAHTSKHGWVISKNDIPDRPETSYICFCPFTKETFTLPPFHHGGGERIMTISSYPTSKDCVFFVVFDDISNRVTKVATYKHGYENWITQESDSGMPSVATVEYLVCFQGDLYCFQRDQRRLFVYSFAQQCWNNSFHTLETQYYCAEYYLLESDGELLLVCTNGQIHWWAIYTFDTKSPSGWVVKTTLPNRALFIGHRLMSVPASGEFKHMENKIFYCDRFEKKSKFYNLIDGRTYNCEDTHEYQMLARNYDWSFLSDL